MTQDVFCKKHILLMGHPTNGKIYLFQFHIMVITIELSQTKIHWQLAEKRGKTVIFFPKSKKDFVVLAQQCCFFAYFAS